MTTQHLGHDADRAQTGHRLQHGDNLTVPDRCQRIRPAASARGLLLGWQPGIGIKPGTGRDAERRLGGSGLTCVGSTKVHVQSHLLIRDVIAGHRGLFWGVESPTFGTRHGVAGRSQAEDRAVAGFSLRPGYAQPAAEPGVIHPDCR